MGAVFSANGREITHRSAVRSSAVLTAMDADAFRSRPAGGFLSGSSWIYFCLDERLFGFVLWGTPSTEDMSALVRLLEIELDRPPHAALVDVRGLAVALAPSFEQLADYFRRHADDLARVVTRSAIVKPDGLAGAVAAGFLETVPPTFSATLWSALVPALASLDVERPEEVAAVIERAQAEAAGTPDVLRELHAWLDHHLGDGTLEAAARALAMAPRTLQRRLGEAATSFAEEIQLARVRHAKRMLLETDQAITAIAIDVGCASPQHLSTLFKKHVGETPTAWRARTARR